MSNINTSFNQHNQNDSFLSSLSLSLSSNIKYISNCSIRFISKYNPYPYKSVIIAVSDSKVFIINNSLSKIEFSFSFEQIEKVKMETKKKNSIVIYLNNFYQNNKKIPFIYCLFQGRNKFIAQFKSVYSSYYAVHYFTYKELDVFYTKEIVISKGQQLNDNNYLPLMHCPPEMFKLIQYNSYYFFAPPNFVIQSKNLLRAEMLSENYSINFYLHINAQQVISNIMIDVKAEAQNYLNRFINKNYKGNLKYYFVVDEVYYKKYNFNEDISKYIGYKIKCIMIEPEKIEFDLFLIRRLYEPPFFETYSDFFFLFKIVSNVEEKDNQIENEIRLIVDSLYIENIPNIYDYEKIINMKFESLVYNYHIMKYIIQTTNIIHISDVLKLGIKFVILVISDIIWHFGDEEDNKDYIIELSSILSNIMKSYNINQSEIENLSTSQIFIEFENVISLQIKKYIKIEDMKNKCETEWEKKVKVFLLLCINGGICGDAFNLKKLFSIKKHIISNSKEKKNTNLHDDTLIRLLFEDSNDNFSNTFQSLSSHKINMILLSKIIRHYNIKYLLDIQDEVQFYIYQLENNFNYKILKSLIAKFDTFIIDNKGNYNELIIFFTRFSELKVVFINILKNSHSSSKSKICSCKGLIYCCNYNENKTNMINSLISLGLLNIISSIKTTEHDRELLEHNRLLYTLITGNKNSQDKKNIIQFGK